MSTGKHKMPWSLVIALTMFFRPAAYAEAMLFSLLNSPVTNVSPVVWNNAAANNIFTAGANWIGGVAPGTNDLASIDLSGGNKAVFTGRTNIIQRAYIGTTSGQAGELNIAGGCFRAIYASTSGSRIGAGGGTGILSQSGGTAEFGHIVDIGRVGSSGTYNLSGGLLDIFRSSVINGVNTSLQLGNGGGTGTMNITGGKAILRAGVQLQNTNATFRVGGSGCTEITIGSDGEGYWYQGAGALLDAQVDTGGLTAISINFSPANTGGNVVFDSGALLNVGFLDGSDRVGSWDVMTWDGTMTDNGLIFSSGVDTNVWSFAFIDTDASGSADTLRVIRWNIGSIADLQQHRGDSNSDFVMKPGTYAVDSVTNGTSGTNVFLLISGNNNTWDFTGVTFSIGTNFYKSFGGMPVHALVVTGSCNTVAGLTISDVSSNCIPRTGTHMAEISGVSNELFKCVFETRGSFPYGYGDMFGRGSPALVSLRKKAALRVSGKQTRIIYCRVYMRTFGHGIYMRGAEDTYIEGCYVEGEIRNSNEILAEANTLASSNLYANIWNPRDPDLYPPSEDPADYYPIGSDWIVSLCEDGIRAYPDGVPYGGKTNNITRNITAKNCTVKRMREGIKLCFSAGTNIVNECLVSEIDYCGFVVGNNGKVINSFVDRPYGNIFSTMDDSETPGKNISIDITVLNYYTNRTGSSQIASIMGSGHTITINTGINAPYPAGTIAVGGSRAPTWRVPNPTNSYGCSNTAITNWSGHSLLLNTNISGLTISSVGSVVYTNGILPVGITTNPLTGTVATASSSAGPKTPDRTINGILTGDNDYWDNTDGINGWIRYDLQSTKTISRVSVLWYTNGVSANYSFRIEVSSNAVNWVSATNGTGCLTNTFVTYDLIPAATGRYFRLVNNTTNRFRLREVDADFYTGHLRRQ